MALHKHLLVGWRFDPRSGSVIGDDDDGDDIVIFRSRRDSRSAQFTALNRETEEAAMRIGAEAPALLAAAREFCRKVDAGEAKSKKTYTAFAAILKRIDTDKPPSGETQP